MKHYFIGFCLSTSSIILGQNTTELSEKVLDEMCVEFTQTAHLPDDERVYNPFIKYLIPHKLKFKEEEWEVEFERIFLRFQRKCDSFKHFLIKTQPIINENYEILSEKPQANISKKDLADFKKQHHFYYLHNETNEKILVQISKNHWTENFADGTFSKTYFRWIGENKFELEFIESNNFQKNSLNKKGDKYYYEILNKENDFYWILTEVEGQSILFKYKLFVGK